MINYLGCTLFGVFFLVMTAKTGGSGLGARMADTLSWFHNWSPFSYLIVLAILAPVGVVIRLMSAQPELEKDPSDWVVEYRHEGSGTEDTPIAAEECVEASVETGVSGINQVTD